MATAQKRKPAKKATTSRGRKPVKKEVRKYQPQWYVLLMDRVHHVQRIAEFWFNLVMKVCIVLFVAYVIGATFIW